MKRKSAVLALAVIVLSATAVQAVPTTYVYTGNPFTDVNGPYTTSMFVTAMVRLAAPLPPNFSGNVTPTAFTLFDGVQILTSNEAGGDFIFVTNAAGVITQWFVLAADPRRLIDTSNLIPFSRNDEGVFQEKGFNFSGSNFGSPGVWTITTGGVPDAGSTLLLMTLTLTGGWV
jgi:hypothetical protein